MPKDRIKSWLENAQGGHTREELDAAFELVKDKEHWKNPIDAVVDEGMVHVLTFAIPWFTGTPAEFEPCEEAGKIRVRSIGYWAGPCN